MCGGRNPLGGSIFHDVVHRVRHAPARRSPQECPRAPLPSCASTVGRRPQRCDGSTASETSPTRRRPIGRRRPSARKPGVPTGLENDLTVVAGRGKRPLRSASSSASQRSSVPAGTGSPHPDHRVAGDQRASSPRRALRSGRSLGQHQITHLRRLSQTRMRRRRGSRAPSRASTRARLAHHPRAVRAATCTRPAAAPARATGSRSTACTRRRCGPRGVLDATIRCRPPGRRSRARRSPRCRRRAAAPGTGIGPRAGDDLGAVQRSDVRLVVLDHRRRRSGSIRSLLDQQGFESLHSPRASRRSRCLQIRLVEVDTHLGAGLGGSAPQVSAGRRRCRDVGATRARPSLGVGKHRRAELGDDHAWLPVTYPGCRVYGTARTLRTRTWSPGRSARGAAPVATCPVSGNDPTCVPARKLWDVGASHTCR